MTPTGWSGTYWLEWNLLERQMISTYRSAEPTEGGPDPEVLYSGARVLFYEHIS